MSAQFGDLFHEDVLYIIPRIDTVRRDDVMEIGGLDRIHIDLKF